MNHTPSRMLSQDSDSIIDVAGELHDAAGRNEALEAEYEAARAEVEAFFDRIRDRALTIRDANEAMTTLILEMAA